MKYSKEKRLEKENGKCSFTCRGKRSSGPVSANTSRKGSKGWPTRYECPLIRPVGYSPLEYMRVYRILVNAWPKLEREEERERGEQARATVRKRNGTGQVR